MASKTCMIFGAGATAFCDVANPDRRPPLVSSLDFARMFEEPLVGGIISSGAMQRSFVPFLRWGLEYFGENIEDFFTAIHLLGRHHSSEGLVERTAETYRDHEWREKLIELARKMVELAPNELPRNFLTILTGIVREEITFCVGTTSRRPHVRGGYQPLSQDHVNLCRPLRSGDVVISFNYDEIVDYALLNLKLLSPRSFVNPGFDKVAMLGKYTASGEPVKLYKPHGSFNWGERHMSHGLHYSVFLGTHHHEDYDFLAPLILPFRAKWEVLDDYPIFRSELINSLTELAQSDQLVVIGKQFRAGDQDLAALIRAACKHKARWVTYVDPKAAEHDWRQFHDELFNAQTYVKSTWFPDIAHCLREGWDRFANLFPRRETDGGETP
ncbi:MAG TPA: hypothetical protein VNE39_26135 [Planctomycetota bacterium]|nr:hypothetical protein [Planctomycetota bacterium]